MSGSLQQEKAYPKDAEDIETEKEIVEEIKKISPLPLKLKAFALNHHTLRLKELGTQEENEIDQLNIATQKSFQANLPNINDIVNGTRQPTAEELKDLDQYLTEEEKAKKDEILAAIKPIADYWLTVLKNDSVIKPHINENDEKALKHLTRIEYKLSEDAATPHNFTITLHFSANEFFSNETLTVNFHMKEARDVTKTEGTQIQWKEGHNFTKKQVTKKQKNKKTGQTRTVTKEETVPSFFNLFSSIVAPEEDKEELDEEEERLQNEILDQVDIGYSLIEEAVPFSLEYFLGVRKDDLYGDEDDFEDDEDDEDDDEEDAKPKGKKGGKALGAGAGAAGAGGKQECKQQ